MFIYILKLSNGKHYTGITKDIGRRMKEHGKGLSISTRKHLPLVLEWYKVVEDRKEARRVEIKIKKRGAKRFLRDLEYKNTQYTPDCNIWI